LIDEVSVSLKLPIQVSEIKKRIESLINRGYFYFDNHTFFRLFRKRLRK